ncbi:hypothetical protein ABZ756_02035 [Mammaliicoccus sciuri]
MAWELVETQTKRGDQLGSAYTHGYNFQSALVTNYGDYPSVLHYSVNVEYMQASSSYVSGAVFAKKAGLFNFDQYRYLFQLDVNGTPLLDQIVESGRSNAADIKRIPFTLERRLDTDVYTVKLFREKKNTAPTTPGAFTQPTGTLEIGDTKAISWGGSTDADGNLHGYEFEVLVDGGPWINRGFTTTPSFNYVIPTATTIKFRVRARDSAGLYSSYRESPVFTVSKPTYYWSKYNSVNVSRYHDNSPWVRDTIQEYGFYVLSKSYTFDSKLNTYSVSAEKYKMSDVIKAGDIGYLSSSNEKLVRFTAHVDSFGDHGTMSARDVKDRNKNEYKVEFVRGSLIQTNIQDVEGTYPADGRHSDGYWYVRGSRVNQSIAPPGPFTEPYANTVLEPRQTINLVFSTSPSAPISVYEVQRRYNGGSWSLIGEPEKSITKFFTVTDDKSLTSVEFRVRAKNTSGVYSDYVYSEVFVIQHNKIPTLSLETENNKTLYEKDTFSIKGSAIEPDVGDVLIVYYRLNGGTARGIETKLSDGSAIPFNEQLLFKSGMLYKGETEITGKLTEGTAHTLEVWAADNQGGESEIERRTFYVVPNRPPSLTIDPITGQSDLINVDKVTVTGESFDPDGNDVVVRYRINNGINVEIHNGPAGEFSFDILLSKLKDGENSIVVEVSDTFDFKFSETIKLNKTANLTPLASAVQRYTIVPPAGSAQGVLLWIKRDEAQDVTVEISMTNGTEPEDFKPMEFDSSGPDEVGTVEDFYKFRSDVSAEKIAIKLSWTGDKPIHQIQGALTQ